MSPLIVTLHSPSPRGTLDLELPAEVSLQNLLPELARVLQLPLTDGAGQPISYQLAHQARGRSLGENETLQSAGIVTGDVLSLVSAVSPSGAVPAGASGGHWGASALLRCASGKVIALDNFGETRLTIGRYDARTGKSPEIDLSEEPDGNTVSRAHALICKQGNEWTLVPLSPRNPTRVGNADLVPGKSWPLKTGDVITLGAVRLVFETARPF
jgi:uncharacterized ubiquitin-like protein YukD